jgi:hypothetical protein
VRVRDRERIKRSERIGVSKRDAYLLRNQSTRAAGDPLVPTEHRAPEQPATPSFLDGYATVNDLHKHKK